MFSHKKCNPTIRFRKKESCVVLYHERFHKISYPYSNTFRRDGRGRVVRWSWVNFQCRGVLLVWIRVGQGPTALAVGAGGGCLDIFTLIYPFSSFSLSLGDDPI